MVQEVTELGRRIDRGPEVPGQPTTTHSMGGCPNCSQAEASTINVSESFQRYPGFQGLELARESRESTATNWYSQLPLF